LYLRLHFSQLQILFYLTILIIQMRHLQLTGVMTFAQRSIQYDKYYGRNGDHYRDSLGQEEPIAGEKIHSAALLNSELQLTAECNCFNPVRRLKSPQAAQNAPL
jgi:hypothetical protein